MTQRILIVDDEPDVRALLAKMVTHLGHDATEAESAAAAIEALDSQPFDLVFSDVRMPDMDGLEMCRQALSKHPDLCIVVLTAYPSMDSAIEAIRAGACDFLSKPFTVETVRNAIDRATHQRAQRRQSDRLAEPIHPGHSEGGLVAASAVMSGVRDMIERAAESEATVLLTGETGSGKEIAARELHRLSKRADGPFIGVNCAALPEQLLESELFGHVKGSFTGASRDHTGLLVQASGGTLFLDEIAEMPLPLQPKLLRALQERSVRPVGGEQHIDFDTRLVCATNRNLDQEVAEGRFREDLFFRVNVVHIELPSLRRRGQDILLLAQTFIEEHAKRSGKEVEGLTAGAAEKLMMYPWPGNVRELENAMERAVAMTRHRHIVEGDLPKEILEADGQGLDEEVKATPMTEDNVPTLQEVERRHIVRVLNIADGNKTRAAKLLGLDRKTLYRRLKRYGLDGAA